MLPVPATEESDDFHPMEGPLLPPDQDPQTPPTTVQHGHFQTLQLSLDDEARSRHDQSLHHCQWRGVILENQTVIPPGVENFDLPYHGSERLGRREAVTRRTLHSHYIISKQYSRADFKRAEVELAITSGCGTMTETIGVIWNHCTVQILQKCFNGVTLTELLKTRQRLTDLEVNLLNYRLLLFLKNIHNKRILHRNIDPDHIMISRQDLQIYVVGCSALCKIDDSIPDFFGTPYSSPEVARGEHHGYKTDVFSLGCTMLSAVSGRIPYCGTDRQQIYLTGILHRIAIGEFPVDDILRDMEDPTSLRDMISDMTQYPQEERLSVDELLQKYYSHGDNAPSHVVPEELSHVKVNFLRQTTTSHLQSLDAEPSWESWSYLPEGTAPPVDQYRRTPEPTVPRPPMSDGPNTVNLPSAEILEGSSDNGEEGGEDEGEDEGVVLRPKPPSDHLSDSGRQTISDVLSGPPTGLNDIAETEENNLGIPCNPGPTYPEEFYTIEVKENERLVCEVTCRPDSLGRDLHSCVKEKFLFKIESMRQSNITRVEVANPWWQSNITRVEVANPWCQSNITRVEVANPWCQSNITRVVVANPWCHSNITRVEVANPWCQSNITRVEVANPWCQSNITRVEVANPWCQSNITRVEVANPWWQSNITRVEVANPWCQSNITRVEVANPWCQSNITRVEVANPWCQSNITRVEVANPWCQSNITRVEVANPWCQSNITRVEVANPWCQSNITRVEVANPWCQSNITRVEVANPWCQSNITRVEVANPWWQSNVKGVENPW